jgi:hypothetical protein
VTKWSRAVILRAAGTPAITCFSDRATRSSLTLSPRRLRLRFDVDFFEQLPQAFGAHPALAPLEPLHRQPTQLPREAVDDQRKECPRPKPTLGSAPY